MCTFMVDPKGVDSQQNILSGPTAPNGQDVRGATVTLHMRHEEYHYI